MLNLKYYLNKLYSPLLFYIDKAGNSVFKNYSFFKNDGCIYDEIIRVKDAGKVLEYRMELDKKLKKYNIFVTFLTYLFIIYSRLSLKNLIFFFILWLTLLIAARLICQRLYSKELISYHGHYQITDFRPHVKQEKLKLFKTNFYSKILIYIVIIGILFLPSIFLLKITENLANKKDPNLRAIQFFSSIYKTFYPKTALIHDINAVSKYKHGDFVGAADEYIEIFRMSGKKFSSKDYKRFANLLLLVKKAKGARNAIDVFNEYATRKKMNAEQELKMLWIKSIFSISSGIEDYIIQDYDDLIKSVTNGDKKHEFYILADKAYMLYLIKDYNYAIKIYNNLILFAHENIDKFGKELKHLYIERGFSKLELGDKNGANEDFEISEVPKKEISNYEPTIRHPEFIIGDF